jgi:hypothetical protein
MGGQGSGGPNGGPQYNPANVSGTGGAGQSGDYTGFAYGENKEINQSRVQGNEAVATTKAAGVTTSQAPYEGINMPQLGTLLDPTNNPSEPISAGVDFGRGPGSEALPKGFGGNTLPEENAEVIRNYLPDLAFAAQSPSAPDSFKRFVNYLVDNSQRLDTNG